MTIYIDKTWLYKEILVIVCTIFTDRSAVYRNLTVCSVRNVVHDPCKVCIVKYIIELVMNSHNYSQIFYPVNRLLLFLLVRSRSSDLCLLTCFYIKWNSHSNWNGIHIRDVCQNIKVYIKYLRNIAQPGMLAFLQLEKAIKTIQRWYFNISIRKIWFLVYRSSKNYKNE